MYSRQELSQTRQRFWTRFGQYMRPVKGANGDTINWMNYKTGIRHIFFRMDAGTDHAAIAIELQHTDRLLRHQYLEQFLQLRALLEEATGEKWDWEADHTDEHGKTISRIGTAINGVNIFREEDWPAIISFLKPRIIALDQFWWIVKDAFE
jgi:hypothetical protein